MVGSNSINKDTKAFAAVTKDMDEFMFGFGVKF